MSAGMGPRATGHSHLGEGGLSPSGNRTATRFPPGDSHRLIMLAGLRPAAPWPVISARGPNPPTPRPPAQLRHSGQRRSPHPRWAPRPPRSSALTAPAPANRPRWPPASHVTDCRAPPGTRAPPEPTPSPAQPPPVICAVFPHFLDLGAILVLFAPVYVRQIEEMSSRINNTLTSVPGHVAVVAGPGLRCLPPPRHGTATARQEAAQVSDLCTTSGSHQAEVRVLLLDASNVARTVSNSELTGGHSGFSCWG